MNAIEWLGRRVRFIDQTRLPLEEIYIETDRPAIVAEAIRKLKIRGAPLIGIAAAYGVALSGASDSAADLPTFRHQVQTTIDELSGTRPTAVNLFWALRRMKQVLQSAASVEEARGALVEEACRIHREDEEMCRRIGFNGAARLPQKAGVLTHCNTGALATGGEGTAQSIITTAHRQGKQLKVFVDETRPLLQGARLTAWELLRAGIDLTLVTDSTSAFLMKQGKIDAVIIGADRIAANGDVANKIGSYSLAVLASHHGIPFYVAAPSSTIDASIAFGDLVEIELRDPGELTSGFGSQIAPTGVNVYSPAFDITPARLITAIITETGVYTPPFDFHLPVRPGS